ncbi:MAG: redoxin domain-containing protein, partial [Paracoccaceae bacterium]
SGSVRRVSAWKWALGGAILGMLGLFAAGLGRDTSYIPSPLIGNPAPAFEIERLDGEGMIRLSDYRGKAVILNFWASWCSACLAEHDLLIALGNRFEGREDVTLVGIDYKDSRRAAGRYFIRNGAFPYESGFDPRARTGVDFGVYGMPETFFIDARGIVVAKVIGPLTLEAVNEHLSLLGITL